MIKRAIRTLHVVASLDHGGTEVACRDLIGELNRRSDVANPVTALIRGSGSIEPELAGVSGQPIRVLKRGHWRRFLQFYWMCRALKPSAVMFHFFHLDHVVMASAARLAGVHAIFCKAGNPASVAGAPNARKWRFLIQLTRVLGCKIVCASAYIETSLRKLARLPDGSCVIHHGCDFDAIRARAKKARAAKSAAVTVGMISRLDPIKDHDTLLEAFALVARSDPQPDVLLRIVGDGELQHTLRAKAAALGVADKVEFLGIRSDVAEQLGQFDVFAFSTTLAEGFGIVLIEALAAGVPVIASDVPACREVLRGGEFGQLLAPKDPQPLARAISGFLDQAKMSKPGPVPDRAVIEEAYGLQAMAQKHWDLLLQGSSR